MAERQKLMDAKLLRESVVSAFKKLNPGHLWRNPVMFIVEIGAAVTTYFFFKNLAGGLGDLAFIGSVTIWLWFTVLFANFAEAVAEGRGRAQAETLRKTRVETTARLVKDGGETEMVPAGRLRKGDVVIV